MSHDDALLDEWLSKLKLPEYSGNFKRMRLNRNSVLALTDAELSRIGVDKLGHRKRMLKYLNVYGTDQIIESPYANAQRSTTSTADDANRGSSFSTPPVEAAPTRPNARRTGAPPSLSRQASAPVPAAVLQDIPAMPTAPPPSRPKAMSSSTDALSTTAVADSPGDLTLMRDATMRKKTRFDGDASLKAKKRLSAQLRTDAPLPPPPSVPVVDDDDVPPPIPSKAPPPIPVGESLYSVPRPASPSNAIENSPNAPALPPRRNTTDSLAQDATTLPPQPAMPSSNPPPRPQSKGVTLAPTVDVNDIESVTADDDDDGCYFQLPRGPSNASMLKKRMASVRSSGTNGSTVEGQAIGADSDDSNQLNRSTSSLPVYNKGMNLSATKSAEKRGFLDKKGGLLGQKGWDRRYCIYANGIFQYYLSDKDIKPQGTILLADMKEVVFNMAAKGKKTSHPNRFNLVTYQRTYYFNAEDPQSMTEWMTFLGTQIQLHKPTPTFGGAMANPDVDGWLKLKSAGSWTRKYLTLKGSNLNIYNSFEDYKAEKPEHALPTQLMNIKLGGSGKKLKNHQFLLNTNMISFEVQASSADELSTWVDSINNSIFEALNDMKSSQTESRNISAKISKDEVIRRVRESGNNACCAECGDPKPEWASLQIPVVFCINCAGPHRNLGTHISKSRSLTLDEWELPMLDLLCHLGSSRMNTIFEATLAQSGDTKPTPAATPEERQAFIHAKYVDRKWLGFSVPVAGVDLSQALFDAVATDDTLTAVQYILAGAAKDFKDEKGWSVVRQAYHHRQEEQVELLKSNGFSFLEGEKEDEDAARSSSSDGVTASGHRHTDSGIPTLETHYEGVVQMPSESGEWGEHHAVFERVVLEIHQTLDPASPVAKRIPVEVMKACAPITDDPEDTRSLIITTVSGAQHFLAAVDTEQRDKWTNILQSNIDAIPEEARGFDFDGCSISGMLGRQERGSGQWKESFYALVGRLLVAFSSKEDPVRVDEVDLRSVLRYESGIATPSSQQKKMAPGGTAGYIIEYAVAPSPTDFSLIFRQKVVVLRAQSPEERERWLTSLRQLQVFARELDTLGPLVPPLVEQCINFVETYGCLTEGVYRVPGSSADIRELRFQFDSDPDSVRLTVDKCQVHDVAGLLKLFFKTLPEPLIAGEILHFFFSAIAKENEAAKHAAVLDLLTRISYARYETLKRMCVHLHSLSRHSATNKMTCANLAVVFGPTFCLPQGDASSFAGTTSALKLVEYLITNCEALFDVPVQSAIDKAIESGISRIQAAREAHKKAVTEKAETFLYSIYFGDEEGALACSFALDATASDAVLHVLSSKRDALGYGAGEMPDKDTLLTEWGLYEHTNNGLYTRTLLPDELLFEASQRCVKGDRELRVKSFAFRDTYNACTEPLTGYLYLKNAGSGLLKNLATRMSSIKSGGHGSTGVSVPHGSSGSQTGGQRSLSRAQSGLSRWKRLFCEFNPRESSAPLFRLRKEQGHATTASGTGAMTRDKRVYIVSAEEALAGVAPSPFLFVIQGVKDTSSQVVTEQHFAAEDQSTLLQWVATLSNGVEK